MWPGRGRAQPDTEGLPAVPPDRPLSRRHLLDAASAAPGQPHPWHVLTDPQPWSAPPLRLPEDPAAWYQLAAVGGWQTVLVDTGHAAGEDLVLAHHAGQDSVTARWCALPCAVPVWCSAATSAGVARLLTALSAADAAHLPLRHSIVVLAATGDGRTPAPVRAAAAMLSSRVAAVVDLPYDPRVRSHGPVPGEKLSRRLSHSGDGLAAAVLAAAHARFGNPVPAAAQPAPIPVHPPSSSP
ncbi:hypothetical protein GCM10009716_49380 [Streptomyces sodiiphilus]|uniref:Alpha/beta hydrolase n=1 Tax=Streptomyces sodiiphilus TaxID=226217 RepID=A0ABN2PXZ3_9ACTN